MDLTHHFSVPVPVEQAWRVLNHPELLDHCFPGLTIDNVAGDAFTGSIKVKIGPIGLVYAGSGRYVERDSEIYRLILESHGADRRGNGTADARVVAALTGNGEATDVELSTDLSVTGKPAQFGADVIADVGDKLMAQFASCATTWLAEGFDAPPVPAPLHQAWSPAVPEAVSEPDAVAAAEQPEQVESPEQAESLGALEDTIELGVVPDEVDWPIQTETEPETEAEPQATPPAPPAPPPDPYRFTPSSDLAEPHAARAISTAAITLLRRHGPALGAGFLAALVLIRIINRVRGR